MESVGTYKSTKTQRNITYGYWAFPDPGQGHPTILFLHGYPSTSHDWDAQFACFAKIGYGVIVPDMLGYGGTDKPLDVQDYKAKPITQDMVDILDNEGVDSVVVVSHDWGVLPGSRLINYFPERIIASVFISLGYFPPQPNFDIDVWNDKIKEMTGQDAFGYWEFFASGDAADIITTHIDSFCSLIYTSDPTILITEMAPKGKLRLWLENDKRGPGIAPYITEEHLNAIKERILSTGVAAPLRWYLARVKAIDNENEAQISLDRHKITHPTLFVATLQDYIGSPKIGIATMQQYAENLKIEEIDASHWVMLEKPEELNAALVEFLKSI